MVRRPTKFDLRFAVPVLFLAPDREKLEHSPVTEGRQPTDADLLCPVLVFAALDIRFQETEGGKLHLDRLKGGLSDRSVRWIVAWIQL